MAINFPSSPATNDTFTGPTGLEYIFDGVKWRSFKPSEPVVGTFNANSAISLSAGGTNQNITLTPSGTGVVTTPASVGIGTTAPTNSLHINRTVSSQKTDLSRLNGNYTVGNLSHGIGFSINANAVSSGIYTTESGGAGASLIFTTSPSYSTPTNVERMRIDSSGNVGIGTSSPVGGLHINTATRTLNLAALASGGGGASYIMMGNSDSGGVAGPNVIFSANRSLVFGVGDSFSSATGGTLTEYMRISNAGLVGIATGGTTRFALSLGTTTSTGTATPITLDLGGTYSSTAGANLKLRLYWDGTNAFGLGISSNQLDYAVPASASHVWYIAGTERLRVDSSGNVGIGVTPSASYKLDVNGSVGANGSITIGTGGTFVAGSIYSDANWGMLFRAKQVSPAQADFRWANSADTERMRIAANGNVGIGNTTPSVALEVTGNIKDTLGLVRAAPIQTKSGAYVVVAADAGATIYISTGGVTINASILSAGDMITIVNNSASNRTITAGASVTFRLAGTATTGNRTLAQYGMATFLCVVGGATPTFHCSGAGLT